MYNPTKAPGVVGAERQFRIFRMKRPLIILVGKQQGFFVGIRAKRLVEREKEKWHRYELK